MSTPTVTPADLERAIRNVPDFPKPGIQFKDITPVLQDPRLFAASVELLTADLAPGSIQAVVGIDARGFIFAAAAAFKLGAGLVPIRKSGKLPYRTFEQSYDLEYGSNTLAVHVDAVPSGSRVLLLDDLLATGGTAQAAAALLTRLGAQVVRIGFLVELSFLKGRTRLRDFPVQSLVVY
ncbi:MAG: adenine phosphoribosyltransferase [Verrucomicrobia bacterium]|nr:adenine phosphoribosyltransferase [Verrucomicrobiota bacterium]